MNKKNKKFVCDLCGLKFSIEDSLVRHKQHIHGEKIEYKCTQCQNGYAVKSSLVRHVKLKHSIVPK